jgi:capsular polysaccharide biosynthesis protein
VTIAGDPWDRERHADDELLRVGSFTAALARNWWVVIALVAIGAFAGAAFTLLAPDEYTATASVYIGQTTDANGNPMPGLNSNSRAATQLLDSEAVLAAAGAEVDMSVAELRRSTMVETPSQTIRTTQSVVNIVVISVSADDAQRAADAANALADELLRRVTPGAEERVGLLVEQRDQTRSALEASRERAAEAQRQLERLGAAGSAAAAAPYLAVVQAAATEQEALLGNLQRTELMLQVARTVEQPRLLHEAVPPTSPSGPNLALNVGAGALVGLVVGLVAAFVRARLRPSAASALQE